MTRRAVLALALALAVPSGTALGAGTAAPGGAVLLVQEQAPATAETRGESVARALDLADVFDIIAEEGLAHGTDLEAEMFPGAGGTRWRAAVEEIYAAERVLPEFIAALDAALGREGADVAPMLDFFGSELGRKAVSLEVSARRALLDEAVEDASKLRIAEMRADRDPRLDRIEAFVAANDLIEANVTGGLNASLAFYQGLATAGAFGEDISEAEMLEDVWSQEPAIRADTEEWLYAMLAMAYNPLTDEELAAYTAFSESEAGRQLNRALFAAFDVVFTDISRRLGTTAAGFVAGQEL